MLYAIISSLFLPFCYKTCHFLAAGECLKLKFTMYHRAAEVCPHMQQALPLVEVQWHIFHNVKFEFRQLWSGKHGQGDLLIDSMVRFCNVPLAPTP